MSQEIRTASAPGRANLIGEHTDYNGGRCLPLALPLRTTARWTPDGTHGPKARLLVRSQEHGEWQGTIDDLGAPVPGWVAYATGALSVVGHRAGGTLSISSTVPSGAGLSSSAAVICAVLAAVTDLSPGQLIEPAIEAETVWAQAPTGGLDQTISLLASPGTALLLDFSDGSRSPQSWLPEADGVHLMVVDSRTSHAHADGGYGQRRAECDGARGLLGVDHLAHADLDDTRDLPEILARRARHVVTETARVTDVVDAAAGRDWAHVGALFNASHASLRDDFEVSCPEVDVAVEAALEAGALGARMTGGGFGGSLLVLTRTPDAAFAAISATYRRRGWRAPQRHEAPASAGASRHL